MKEKIYSGGKYSPEKFVRVWQKSVNLNKAASELGQSKKVVSAIAAKYRKMGIPLKLMQSRGGGAKLNIDALKKLAKKLAPT